MTKEAIKDEVIQDVSTDAELANVETPEIEVELQEKEKVEPKLSARDRKMQEIVDAQQAALDDNHGEPIVDRDFQQVGKPEDEETPDADEPIEPEKPASPFYLNDNDEYVMKLKVNGQEIERSVEQIKVIAQKNESADVRLQSANQREQALQEYETELRAKEQRLMSLQITPQPSNKQDAGSEDNSLALKEVIESIYDGETESAVEKLSELMQGRQEPTLDMSQLASMAKEEALTVMREEARQSAYAESLQRGTEWINEHHSEIMDDPTMRSIVDSQTTVIMRENPQLPPEEVIKQATEKVLSVTRKEQTTESNRALTKSQLQSHPKRQASKRYTPPKEPVIDTSPAAVIARIKASRGNMAKRRSV